MAIDAVRVKQLFLAASDFADVAERAAFLALECKGDAELLSRVEALLRANDAAPMPLTSDEDASRQKAPERTGRTEFFGDPTASVGSMLAGKYKLIQEIGEGGMGSVYVAQQIEPVKRSVAVKVIKAGMDSRAVLARFEAERQALAMMDHPNIARVLDAGTTQGGRPFFVMELVKGQPITQFCDDRKLTPKQRLELFVPVCHAIQHAHQKGVIHRDIKPSNVLVALFDDQPVPKVIDFGLAKAAGQTLTDKTLMTGFGAVVGTPEYMSPEQASLNNLDIDTRSDVYSLGVLLYELLTGATPVDRKSLGQAAVMEILRIVREVEAPRLSVKLSSMETLASVAANRSTEPANLSRLMKGELDWVVQKALNKDRTRRYETANGIAADILRYLSNEPVVARPPSTAYRLQKTWQRNKFALTAVSGIVASLILGVAASLIQTVRANREANRARVALNELRDTAPAFIEQARGLVAKEQFAEAIDKLDYATKLRPDEADYLIAKANLLQCQFQIEDAVRVYQRALEIRPHEYQAKANVELCDELLAAPRASNGKLTRESLSKLYVAMQQQQRSTAELMPVARLLGEERKLVVAYWLERLKGLPISADRPLEQRLSVRDDGLLALDLSGTNVSDLSALAGAPLAVINAQSATRLTSIAPLRGMNLIELNLANTQVADLSPLEGMQSLEKIQMSRAPVSDLGPLNGIRLKYINITSCPVFDISALRDSVLEHFELMSTRVTDLSPLVGMPLKFLDIGGVPVTDFTPLSELPLEVCNFSGCQLTDLAVLRQLPLKELMLWGCYQARNYAVLSEMTTLELLILPDNFPRLPKDELDAIGALRSHPRLRQLGSESSFDHTTTRSKESFWKTWDRVESVQLTLSQAGIKAKRVKLLNDGTLDLDLGDSSLVDLTVLKGMPIRELWIWKTDVADLEPLRGMALKKLHIPDTKVKDLSPLEGMPLEYLNICNTKVTDISALVGMPLAAR